MARVLVDRWWSVTALRFHDPLSAKVVELVIGDDRASTGVRHDGCETLADVSPELDCAFCMRCHWQCRISGGWFMDMLAEARGATGVVDTCRCTAEVCFDDDCAVCSRLDGELPCPSDVDQPVRTCRGCGCTDDYGCDGGCWWVADDLCSACQ
jgi:hypothetical protein